MHGFILPMVILKIQQSDGECKLFFRKHNCIQNVMLPLTVHSPSAQRQSYPFSASRQVAPSPHGLLEHAITSASHSAPVYPAKQQQLPSKQVPPCRHPLNSNPSGHSVSLVLLVKFRSIQFSPIQPSIHTSSLVSTSQV